MGTTWWVCINELLWIYLRVFNCVQFGVIKKIVYCIYSHWPFLVFWFTCVCKPVLKARSVGTVKQAGLPIRIYNLSNSPVYLSRFQKLAELFLIQPENVYQLENVCMKPVGKGVIEVGVHQVPTGTGKEAHTCKLDWSGLDCWSAWAVIGAASYPV